MKNDRHRYYVTLHEAAAICHPIPGDGGPDEQRRLEAREEAKRQRDEDRADLRGAVDWEGA